jgi:hypothetical protein
MTPEQTIALKLNPALKECHLHKCRIDYALGQLGGKLPLTGQQWQNLDDETVADIDQLLFRYNKLQDAMGQRLFPAILMTGAEWRDEEAFIDKLNRLEKLEAIPSADQWMEIRSIRNRMTHEYPDAPERNAENLARVIDSISQLKNTLAQAQAYAQDLSTRLTSTVRKP